MQIHRVGFDKVNCIKAYKTLIIMFETLNIIFIEKWPLMSQLQLNYTEYMFLLVPCNKSPLTDKMSVLISARLSEVLELLQQEGVFQYPLDGLDEVGLQGGGMLLSRIPGGQELLQCLVTFA